MEQDILKKLITATLLTALIFAPCITDAGQFGPPEPVASEGKVSLEVGYFHLSEILNPARGNSFLQQHDIKQNQVYVQAAYGFIKEWEAYLRIGGSDLKLKDVFTFNAVSSFDLPDTSRNSFRPFGTFGLKGLLYDGGYFGIGPFFQASLFSSYKDKDKSFLPPDSGTLAGLLARSQELKVKNPWDVNLGIGLQTKVYGISLYGGPFAYWTGHKAYKFELASRTAEGCLGGPVGCPDRVEVDKTHYREKNNFGAFVGLRTPLPWVEGVHAEVEGQFKNKGSVGVSLHYSF